MGVIRVSSAIFLPHHTTIRRTPPIPSWQMLGIPLVAPKRWVGLWGYQSTVSALGEARRMALSEGLETYTATVTVTVEKAMTGSIHPHHISDIECLPIDQASRDLLDDLNAILVTSRGAPSSRTSAKRTYRRLPENSVQSRLTQRPELINALFRHPNFRHIRIITWQSLYGIGLGAIRDADCVTDVQVRGLPGPYRLAGWPRTWLGETA